MQDRVLERAKLYPLWVQASSPPTGAHGVGVLLCAAMLDTGASSATCSTGGRSAYIKKAPVQLV